MNQEPERCSETYHNTVVVAHLYACDSNEQEKNLGKYIYEVYDEAYESYYEVLFAAPSILCRLDDYHSGKYNFRELAEKPLGAAGPTELVYVRYGKERSVGCGHQCAGCCIRCSACGRYYGCPICHNEEEDHAFAPGGLQCCYCGHEQLEPALRCGACGRVFGAAYCTECWYYDDYPTFIAAPAHICPAEDELCAVCQVGLHMHRFTTLPCGHRFHLACRHALENLFAVHCPLCRTPFRDETGAYADLYRRQCMNADVYVCGSCSRCTASTIDYYAPITLCARCHDIIQDTVYTTSRGPPSVVGTARNSTDLTHLLGQLSPAERNLFQDIVAYYQAGPNTPDNRAVQFRIALQMQLLKQSGLQLERKLFVPSQPE